MIPYTWLPSILAPVSRIRPFQYVLLAPLPMPKHNWTVKQTVNERHARLSVRDVLSEAFVARKQGSVNFSDWVFLFELINYWEHLSRCSLHIPRCLASRRPDSKEFLSMKRNTLK